MKFKLTDKHPACLCVGEKTLSVEFLTFSITLQSIVGLMLRRSKKGYQVGADGNWSIMFKHFSQITDEEIKVVRGRL